MSAEDVADIKARLARIEAKVPDPGHFQALIGRVLALIKNSPTVEWGPTAPGEVNQLAAALAKPTPVSVDAAAVAAALAGNAAFLASLAKAVNDDLHNRTAN